MNYESNRTFTNYIHKNLAIPTIYTRLGWEEIKTDAAVLDYIDRMCGIDYFFRDSAKKVITVQERFRTNYYAKYDDFTIRYHSGDDATNIHYKSEYYKIRADYMIYGIVNCDKLNYVHNCTEFLKIVLVDLRQLYLQIDSGLIQIGNTKTAVTPLIKCEVKYNTEDKKSFVAFDIPKLIAHFGNTIIKKRLGYD